MIQEKEHKETSSNLQAEGTGATYTKKSLANASHMIVHMWLQSANAASDINIHGDWTSLISNSLTVYSIVQGSLIGKPLHSNASKQCIGPCLMVQRHSFDYVTV